MNRLDELKKHPSVLAKMEGYHSDVVREVAAAVEAHPVVIVGMSQNPHPRQARKLLDAQSIGYHYLTYGSYVSGWHDRLALKIWAGWPTFPMIFVNGTLIGGASDLESLMKSGEFKALLDPNA